ncbi:hypothetical protein GCM10027610_050540 [Dactylosporangium cerinum]
MRRHARDGPHRTTRAVRQPPGGTLTEGFTMRSSIRRLGIAGLGLALTAAMTLVGTTAAHAESNGGVRVMPLGDSITDGFNVQGGYRNGLWQRLANAGVLTDFVGSGSNGPASLGDHDHEGHSGWRIDQLDANIAGWIQAANPRTVLLHIGTNDIGQNYDVPNAPARLSALIDKIRTYAPQAHIFVAQITPLGNTANEAKVNTFNAAIPGIVSQKGPLTHLVDMHTGFTVAGDIADGIHPNAAGYDKMAARWFAALQAASGSLSTLATPPTGSAALLSNPQSKRCLDVSGASITPGAQTLIWDCHAGANQRWTRTAAGSCASTATAASTSTATAPPTARRSRSGRATAARTSGSRSTPTAPSPAWAPASASTSTPTAPRTAPSCSCGSATAPAPRPGPPADLLFLRGPRQCRCVASAWRGSPGCS